MSVWFKNPEIHSTVPHNVRSTNRDGAKETGASVGLARGMAPSSKASV